MAKFSFTVASDIRNASGPDATVQKLDYDNLQTGLSFSTGDIITGVTSSATGTVFLNKRILPNPATKPTLEIINIGNLTGIFTYVITFVTSLGETEAGIVSDQIVTKNQKVKLTGITIGPPGTLYRKIYRTTAGPGLIHKLVGFITGNTETEFIDNISDGNLGINVPGQSGTLVLTSITGTFQDNEQLNVSTVYTADANGINSEYNAEPLWVLNFDNLQPAKSFSSGDIIDGGTSSASGRILSVSESSGSGTLILDTVVGIFQDNEQLNVSTVYIADDNGLAIKSSDTSRFFKGVCEEINSIGAGLAAPSPAPSVAVDDTFALIYTLQTSNFNIGSLILGQTSGATGIIINDLDVGSLGNLILSNVIGAFQNNEIITDNGGSPGSASVSGTQIAVGLVGNYQYKVTFVTADGGETLASIASTIITPATQRILLTNIPISSSPNVVKRRIYRTKSGGSIFKTRAIIDDNVTTVFNDLGFDSVLTAKEIPITNTSGTPSQFLILPGDIDPIENVEFTIKNTLGSSFDWYPVVGNRDAETDIKMSKIRSINFNGNSLNKVVNQGPSRARETIYSFNYDNSHFIILNEYYGFDGGSSIPSAPSVALSGAGNLSVGTYSYKITFITSQGGETLGGTSSSNIDIVNSSIDGKVNLTNIPIGVGNGFVVGRRIYRTKQGGTKYFFVGELFDNITTTFMDNIADLNLIKNIPSLDKSGSVTDHGLIFPATINGLGGKISDELFNWLIDDIERTNKNHIFVIGHSPAWIMPDIDSNNVLHEDDSLITDTISRDKFWSLLSNDDRVVAYICGHTRNYSHNYIDGLWQINAGHARGNGNFLSTSPSKSTFIFFHVDGDKVSFETYRDDGTTLNGPTGLNYNLAYSGILKNKKIKTLKFQNEVFPTSSYQGTSSVFIDQDNPTQNGNTVFIINNVITSQSVQSSLIKWDLSSIPSGMNVIGATISFVIARSLNITFNNLQPSKSFNINDTVIGGISGSSAPIVGIVGDTLVFSSRNGSFQSGEQLFVNSIYIADCNMGTDQGYSSDIYNVNEVKKPWKEFEATWTKYDSSNNWESAGARGVSDIDRLMGFAISKTTLNEVEGHHGIQPIHLTSTGIQVIKDWITNPNNNNGILISNISSLDRITFYSSNTDLAIIPNSLVSPYNYKTIRPLLTLYLENYGWTWGETEIPNEGDTVSPEISLEFSEWKKFLSNKSIKNLNVIIYDNIQADESAPGASIPLINNIGTLKYNNQITSFNIGSILIGSISGANGIIINDINLGTSGTLTLDTIIGVFRDNEIISDNGGPSGSATSNGFINSIGNLSGNYIYQITFQNPLGETSGGTLSTLINIPSAIIPGAPILFNEAGILNYDNKSAGFTNSLLLTGGISSSTGIIRSDTNNGLSGSLILTETLGNFQNNEIITDSGVGTALVNGFYGGSGYLNGEFKYKVTFLNSSGESAGGNESAIISTIENLNPINPIVSAINGTGNLFGNYTYKITFLTNLEVITPPSPTVIDLIIPGNLNGNYTWAVTYVTGAGETEISAISIPITAVATINGQFQINIPLSTHPDVVARKIYRTTSGPGPDHRLVGIVNDNITTVFTDNIADGSLGVIQLFNTTSRETKSSPASISLSAVNNQIDLSGISTGSINVSARRIYRSKDGGPYFQIGEILNNTVTTFTDNMTDIAANLGRPLLDINNTGNQKILLTNIPINSGFFRRIYRAKVINSIAQEYFLIDTIFNDSDTIYLDNIKDTSLNGIKPPIINSIKQQIKLTNIPTGSSEITARKIYRTTGSGNNTFLVGTINDNITTTFTDNISDINLGIKIPSSNTTKKIKIKDVLVGETSGIQGIIVSFNNFAFILQNLGLTSLYISGEKLFINNVYIADVNNPSPGFGAIGGFASMFLQKGDENISPVKDTGDKTLKTITISYDDYLTGLGEKGAIAIRGTTAKLNFKNLQTNKFFKEGDIVTGITSGMFATIVQIIPFPATTLFLENISNPSDNFIDGENLTVNSVVIAQSDGILLDSLFLQSDDEKIGPKWEKYVGSIRKTWKYIQTKFSR